MRKWLEEWDRRRWLRRTGGLRSEELATTLRIAALVSQQPKPLTRFRADSWITGHRELPKVSGRLR